MGERAAREPEGDGIVDAAPPARLARCAQRFDQVRRLEASRVSQRASGSRVCSARDFEAAFSLESFQRGERRSPRPLSQEIFVVPELPQTALDVREAHHLVGVSCLKHAFLPFRKGCLFLPPFLAELFGFPYPIRKHSLG